MKDLISGSRGFTLNVALLFLTVLLVCLLVVSFTGSGNIISLAVFAAILICVIAFLNTGWALLVLIFSMLFSPEIEIAQTAVRQVTIRVEDIFVIIIFCTWFAKTAINKELGFFRRTPVNLPIALYVLISIIATVRGIVIDIINPLSSLFFLLKYIEYFMIFYMFANNIKDLRQIKLLVFCSLLVYALVAANANRQVFEVNFRPRAVTAPFDREGHPEPNTLAGYLLFFIGINLGLFLYSKSLRRRLLLTAMFGLTILPFLWSFSRGGWLGFVFMYLFLLFKSRRMRLSLIIFLILGIGFLPQLLPRPVIGRMQHTFRPGVEMEVFGKRVIVDTSTADRIDAWSRQMKVFFTTYPLLGTGATGIGLADSQYFRVLGEVGIIGLLIFFWLLWTIFKVAYKNFRTIDDLWIKGLSLGYLAGYVGLLVQATVTNIFIIVRIMEPFMFMTAVMAVINDLFATTRPALSNRHNQRNKMTRRYYGHS